MNGHSFLFMPGNWQGQGEIRFSIADDVLPFTMSWQIAPLENGVIRFAQTVDVESFNEPLHNQFCVSDIATETFAIEIENHLVGKIKGKGIFGDDKIAWEFRAADEGFEGFELYEKQDNGLYRMRAEFLGGEGFRTLISGTLVKK